MTKLKKNWLTFWPRYADFILKFHGYYSKQWNYVYTRLRSEASALLIIHQILSLTTERQRVGGGSLRPQERPNTPMHYVPRGVFLVFTDMWFYLFFKTCLEITYQDENVINEKMTIWSSAKKKFQNFFLQSLDYHLSIDTIFIFICGL